jgi:hypothetical protein
MKRSRVAGIAIIASIIGALAQGAIDLDNTTALGGVVVGSTAVAYKSGESLYTNPLNLEVWELKNQTVPSILWGWVSQQRESDLYETDPWGVYRACPKRASFRGSMISANGRTPHYQ